MYFISVLVYLLLVVALLHYSSNIEECRHHSFSDSNNVPSEETLPNIKAAKSDSSSSTNRNRNPYENREDWKTFTEALKKYKVFHKKKLKEFKAGGNVRMLTWACSQDRCSGLGDQLFRIEYFLLLSIMSDRVFTVYWDSKLKRSAEYLLPGEIEWDYFNASRGMCEDKGYCSHHVYDTTSFWGFGWTKREFSDFGKILFSSIQHLTVTGQVLAYNMYIGNQSIMDPGEEVSRGLESLGLVSLLSEKPNNTVFCGHRPLWYTLLHRLGVHKIMEIPRISSGDVQATSPWLYVNHVIFSYLFRFGEDLLSTFTEYQRSLGLHNKDYLALHLRTGFLGTADQEKWITRYIHCGWKFYCNLHHIDCIIKYSISLVKQTLGEDAPIYLSTDSQYVRDKIRSSFADANIIFGNLTLIHSRMSHKAKSCGISNAKSSLEGHLSMWLDYLMLAHGEVMMHSDSSFSGNAAFYKPILHVHNTYVLYDNDIGCLAAYNSGNVTCIC